MASLITTLFSIFLVSLFLSSSSADLMCEQLPQDLCAFAVSSASKRCVLESAIKGDGSAEYQCKTSEVVAERFSDLVETDQCVSACGLDRTAVGISSDALLDPRFRRKLCSTACYDNCPNIVDLYFNLAAAEGVDLPALCEAHRSNPHRSMVALLSSGAAPAPVSGFLSVDSSASSPAPSPSF